MTQTTAQIFFKEFFPHYGLPQSIITDHGVQLNTEFFLELCNVADIRLNLSTSYHHSQTNGLTTRTNEVIETVLRHYVASSHRDWHEKLPIVKVALNNLFKKSIGCTLSQMNWITLPNTPFQAVFNNIAFDASSKIATKATSERATWLGSSEFTNGARKALEVASEFQFARRCVQLAKDCMKLIHEKKGDANHCYNTGENFWLSMKAISLRHPSQQ